MGGSGRAAPGGLARFWRTLEKTRHLKVLGLISHLAVADQADKTYTHKQLQEFTSLLAAARAEGFKLPLQSYFQQRRPLGAAGGSYGPGAARSCFTARLLPRIGRRKLSFSR